MYKHKKGYETYCRLPHPSIRWKEGQVWACPCGNMFTIRKVYRYDSQGGCFTKEWFPIEKELA